MMGAVLMERGQLFCNPAWLLVAVTLFACLLACSDLRLGLTGFLGGIAGVGSGLVGFG